MRIAVVGATGRVGRLAVDEGVRRGYDITGFVRDANKWLEAPVSLVEKDVLQLTKEDVESFDAVISAFGAEPGKESLFADVATHFIEILQGTKTRLIVVGGAGSLLIGNTMLADTPDFPEAFLPTAKGHERALRIFEASAGIDWTYVSPGALFEPGERTGHYATGGDEFFVNEAGESYASMEDYVLALYDEIENRQHVNERFSVVTERGGAS
ncbi:NAD(P)H-binding protein [Savagea sp. SN6]|uniref:NAD(P)H-binding protein n=1 Tax=Savagea serpentis TaxID=2785297 RepID=A0A8J7G3G7_9BACL|nr:NAD(P)H-binding protein [Savagea serpentis]MBF4501550.1 NAD(P)H-binding protein [Savagea serpentis]